jgi:hypothetical protein
MSTLSLSRRFLDTLDCQTAHTKLKNVYLDLSTQSLGLISVLFTQSWVSGVDFDNINGHLLDDYHPKNRFEFCRSLNLRRINHYSLHFYTYSILIIFQIIKLL